MTTYVGFLRAINLGPRNKVAMEDLRQLLTTLGMQEARSLLLSGNVVFRSNVPAPAKLEQLLEAGIEKHLGLKIEFFVRNAKELKDVIAGNPFPAEAKSDPSHLLVLFLKGAPDRAAVVALQKSIVGREVVKAKGAHAYVVYPDGIGRSRLTSALIEKHLGTRATGRNWNTVLKLDAMAGPT